MSVSLRASSMGMPWEIFTLVHAALATDLKRRARGGSPPLRGAGEGSPVEQR